MKKLRLALYAVCLIQALSAATVQFTVTPLGMNKYRDTYSLSGVSLQQNQELDILFNPSQYSNLANGQAPAAYNVMVFQPDAVAGFSGDFSALALSNNAPSGPFSIDFTFLGSGQPGSQSFTISNVDANGNLSQGTAGQTTPAAVSGVPEPATLPLAGFGGAIVLLAARRRSLS